MLALLRSRDILLLILANTFALFGDTALLFVLAVWAQDLTGSTTSAGYVFIALVAPSFFGLLAGPAIDRFQRRYVMMLANGVVVALMFPAWFIHTASDVWILYFIAAGYGLSMVVFQGARAGLVVSLTPSDKLAQVNAVVRTSRQMLNLISPLIGAGLYALTSGPVVFGLVAVVVFVSTIFLVAIRSREQLAQRDVETPLREQLTAGIRHIYSSLPLKTLITTLCIALLVAGFYELGLLAALQAMHKPGSFFGVLSAAQGAGAIVGGIIAPAALRRIGDLRLVGFGFAMQAAGIGIGAIGHLGYLVVAVVLFGWGMPLVLVGGDTAMMSRTPSNLQGRVNTALECVTTVPYVASYGLGSILVSLVDYRFLLGLMCTVTLLCAPPLILAGTKKVFEARTGDPVPSTDS